MGAAALRVLRALRGHISFETPQDARRRSARMSMLRPLFALFSRSLREQSRTKFTSVSRAAIVLIILLCIVSNEKRFLSLSAPGQEVLMMLVMVNFFTITVFGLSTFASAITEEKEEATLGLLRMTRLNPLAILLGKSTARLFDGLLLLAVQLPFTMLCVTLGGVAQGQILRSYAILASYLFLLCNVSLLWSVICRRTSRAAAMTTATGFALYFLPPFLFAMTVSRRFSSRMSTQPVERDWFQALAEWLMSINPVWDLAKTASPRSAGIPFATESILPSLVGGAIAFGLAWILFERFCHTMDESAPGRKAKPATNGVARRRTASRPGRFAIAWKDFHFLGGGYRGIVIRGVAYAGLVLLFMWWGSWIGAGFPRRENYGAILKSFGLSAFTTELGIAGSRIFGVERKRKTLGGLFALPLGTGRIIGEKVLGALPAFIPSFGMFVLGSILYASAQTQNPSWRTTERVVEEAAIFASELILFAVLTTYLSLRMRRSAFAAAIAVMFFGNMFASALLPRFYYTRTDSYNVSVVMSVVILWIFIALLAAAIPRRIAHAAAEE